jgi:hypothetical protein
MPDARQQRIRETLVSLPETRESVQSVVETMLEAIAHLDDDAAAPVWAENAPEALGCEPAATAGELRGRLREMLTEIAERDA